MSSATLTAARDEVIGLVYEAWKADPLTQDLTLVFQDAANDIPQTSDGDNNPSAWGRVAMLHTGGGQASLANHQGKRRYNRRGFVQVSIYTPRDTGLSMSDGIAMIVLNALEGVDTPSGVWFRHVRISEVGVDGAWYQLNVLADFNYDEVK